MDLHALRLVTIHPALVHLTIGVLPVVLVGYAVGARRRSTAWTFAGDLALWLGASVTVLTAAFGLVSNFRLFWPGSLGFFRYLHLALGCASTLALGALALARYRRRAQTATRGWVAAAVVVAVLVAATGWVGGEVLVFHAGMAVKGGLGGLLAPPFDADGAGEHPRDFLDAMARLRAHFAAVDGAVTSMVMDHPSDAGFRAVSSESLALGHLARWLGEHAHAVSHDEANDEAEGAGGRERVAGKHAGEGDAGAASPELEQITYAELLQQSALRLRDAAAAHDLQTLAIETGRAAGACAACHQSVRWKK